MTNEPQQTRGKANSLGRKTKNKVFVLACMRERGKRGRAAKEKYPGRAPNHAARCYRGDIPGGTSGKKAFKKEGRGGFWISREPREDFHEEDEKALCLEERKG